MIAFDRVNHILYIMAYIKDTSFRQHTIIIFINQTSTF